MSNSDIKVGKEYVEAMKPADVLKYMAQIGQDLTKYAQQAQAMLAEAEAKGIPVDLSTNEALQKFKPTGEYEVQLVKLRSELMSIGSAIFEQGVKMTQKDLRARLQEMRTPGAEPTPEEAQTRRLDLSRVSFARCVLKQELQFPSAGQTITIQPETTIDLTETSDYRRFKIQTKGQDGIINHTYVVSKLDLPTDILVSNLMM